MTDAIDEFVYKLVLLGEASVGKSSLVVRFVQDQFHNHIESTIGAAFFTKSIPVDGDDVTFEIWDTAGQERYHSLAPMYYRGAKAAIVVYDVTDPASYDRAHKWVDELKSSGGSGTVITLVGNKVRCCCVAIVLLCYCTVDNCLYYFPAGRLGAKGTDARGRVMGLSQWRIVC